MAELLSLNIVHEIRPDPEGDVGRTAIDKRPVLGRLTVALRGVSGDAQLDTQHHGGPDQAVYAYADEDRRWWAGELDRDLPPGCFGENLTTRGLDVTGSIIGERWLVGRGDDAVILEVTAPRVPCQTFARFVDEPHWVKRFTAHGAVGAYLRVRQEGRIEAGDPIEVIHRPSHGTRLVDTYPPVPERMRALLRAADDGELELAATLRWSAELAAART
jgi:MOSC domain-containing protein YiiM